jgi:hypothetical protein
VEGPKDGQPKEKVILDNVSGKPTQRDPSLANLITRHEDGQDGCMT